MNRPGRAARAIWWALPVPLAVLAAVLPGLQAVCLTALLFPALVAYSRFRPDGLVIAFLVCQSLVHLMKRLIFLLGPQPQAVYFGVQLLPSVVLLLLMAAAAKRLRGRRLPWSGRLLAAFLVLSAASTLVSASRLSWLTVLTVVYQNLLPPLLFFAGLFLTPESFARVGRTMAILAGISVLYGCLQLAGGPTFLDRAWAAQTYAYSIHGGKVFAYLEGASPEFRSYSYYADPLTWGFFLVAGVTGAVVARLHGRISRSVFVGTVVLALTGLFFSLTRTAWVGLLAMLFLFGLFGWRSFRRPLLVLGLVIGSFAATVAAGDFLYRELFVARRMPVFQSGVLARYATVGTIEARTSAWTAMREAVSISPAWGQGLGVMLEASRSREAAKAYGLLSSHNFLVELVYGVGIPGALLFLGFLWQLLREGFSAWRRAPEARFQRHLRWLLAYAAGCLVTGYLNGPSFMTSEWFLISGTVAGCQWQMAAAQARRAAHAPVQPGALRVEPQPVLEGRLGG
ncbi:MAG: O-antigen ligase family protein [Bryobacterales bacterium]|nr:O-antigen ligase family protein [Bryobacterales bacterium]